MKFEGGGGGGNERGEGEGRGKGRWEGEGKGTGNVERTFGVVLDSSLPLPSFPHRHNTVLVH